MQVPDAIQIYKMDLETGRARPLTQTDAYHTYPAWSPDGSQIAYVSTESGGVDLFVMDEDGANSQQLTVNIQRVASPSWSPDGTMIVFSGGDSSSPNLYVYSMTTGEVEQITDSALADVEPDWSKHGRFILFTRQQPTGTNSSASNEAGLFLFEVETAHLILVEPATENDTPLINAQWLPVNKPQFLAQEKNDPTLSTKLYDLFWEDSQTFYRETAVINQNSLELLMLDDTQLITVIPSEESSEIAHLHLDSANPAPQFLTNNSFFESNIDWKE